MYSASPCAHFNIRKSSLLLLSTNRKMDYRHCYLHANNHQSRSDILPISDKFLTHVTVPDCRRLWLRVAALCRVNTTTQCDTLGHVLCGALRVAFPGQKLSDFVWARVWLFLAGLQRRNQTGRWSWSETAWGWLNSKSNLGSQSGITKVFENLHQAMHWFNFFKYFRNGRVRILLKTKDSYV